MVDSMSTNQNVIDIDNENDFTENLFNISQTLNQRSNFYKLWKFENIQCFPGSNSGDNYMSVVKRISLKGKNTKNQDENISLIIKRQIPSRSRRQLYRCDEAFQNEINAYTFIIPMLNQYTTNYSILPQCYYAGQDVNGEIIILEDLKQFGYQMKNRLLPLNFDDCSLVMKKLAIFHAASISAKELHTNFMNNLNHINEIVYCNEAKEFYRNLLNSSINNSLNSLRSSNTDGILTEPIKLIENLQTNLYDKIEYLIINSNHNNNVICHGDLWINNIMFNTNEVIFFDLQTIRYTSPVFDILHFIYTSTKRDLRDKHLNHILQLYCNELIKNLELVNQQEQSNQYNTDTNTSNHINLDIKKIKEHFSIENITNQYYSYILYGLAVCIWILPAVTFDPNNIPNLNSISNNQIQTNSTNLNVISNLTSEYHIRLKDIVLEFYQNGFLHKELSHINI